MERIIRRKPTPDPNGCYGRSRVFTAAFTGYRPQKMPFGFDETDPRCRDFKLRLEAFIEMLVMEGFTHFITGGALGVDMYAAEAICRLKQRYPRIVLEVAVPFDAQCEHWAPYYQERYHAILAAADILTYISHAYTPHCMFARNRYMVSSCDLLVAAYDGQSGGTAMTVAMADEMHKQISLIPPVVEKRRCTA